jgi:DNA-binding XRE family transcriptional regulator
MLENGNPVEFTITGNAPAFYIDLTRRLFPDVKETAKEDDGELMNIDDWDWWKEKTASITPGDHLRVSREMRGMRQSELAKKIGVSPQQISDMEKGRAPIGKKMAMRIGEALNFSYKHFL